MCDPETNSMTSAYFHLAQGTMLADNNNNSVSEDRKKRNLIEGSEDVNKNGDTEKKQKSPTEEKTKKMRSTSKKNAIAKPDAVSSPRQTTTSGLSSIRGVSTEPASWDIETGLHRVVNASRGEKEYISDAEYLLFRVGHGGDVSAIAAMYRKGIRSVTTTTTTTTTDAPDENKRQTADDGDELELRLANGLGDEDTPPAVFALLAHLHQDDQPDASSLAAVALLTVTWENQHRFLRVEWYQVDSSLEKSDLVERRLMLRLSALALLTGSELSIMREPSPKPT